MSTNNSPIRRTVRGRTEERDWAGIYADLADQGIVATLGFEIGRELAPDRIAEILSIAPGTEVVVRRRLQSGNGVPLQIAITWFPPKVTAAIPQLAQRDTGKGGFRARLKDHGYTPTDASTVHGRLATDEEASKLQLHDDDLVVTDEMWTVRDKNSGVVLAVTHNTAAASRNRHTFVY